MNSEQERGTPLTIREMIAFLQQFDPDTAVYFSCIDHFYSGFPSLSDTYTAPLYRRAWVSKDRRGKETYNEAWMDTEWTEGKTIDTRPALIFNIE